MRFWFLVSAILNCVCTLAQTDSTRVAEDRDDGIYLTYRDFRKNIFISREQLITDLKNDQLDLISKTLAADNFAYTSVNGRVNCLTKDLWGFYQNKTLYINYKGEFYRVPVFGAICYLVATVTVVNNGFYDPMFGYGINANRTKEIREFIINFYDGLVVDFTMDKAEELLSRDPVLFAEYKNLSRRSRKDQVNRYIRRFNETHPVYFLK